MNVTRKIEAIKDDVELLATKGYEKTEIGKELNIKMCTLYRWFREYPELELAYEKGVTTRKAICRDIDISSELYELSTNIVKKLIKELGEDKINKDFQLGMNYGYLMCYFNNLK